MKNILLKISIIAVICILLINLNTFAAYNLTLETKTDGSIFAVGGTVTATIDWEQEMQAVGFKLRYNSTKILFEGASVNENYYNISEPISYETSNDTYRDISVQWADGNSKTNMTFRFKTLEAGDANISIIEANAFSNQNLQQPEQINYTTKGSKTIKISSLGDVNLDGKINLKDVIAINKFINNLDELNNEQLTNADVCADGEINQLDLDILNRYVAGHAISFPFIYGDVNCDGTVDITDVTLVQLHNSTNNSYELTREGINRADVNLDGEVNDSDRLIIQRYVSKLSGYEKLPITITKDDPSSDDMKFHIFDIEDEHMISGFDVSDLRVSTIKQQFNSNLSIDFYNKNGEKLNDNQLIATGFKIKIDEKTTEEVSEELSGIIGEYTVIIYGDTTGDGEINALDALALIKDINNKIPFTSEAYRQAGRIVSSNDQKPTAVDALAIVKAANGKYEINQHK